MVNIQQLSNTFRPRVRSHYIYLGAFTLCLPYLHPVARELSNVHLGVHSLIILWNSSIPSQPSCRQLQTGWHLI